MTSQPPVVPDVGVLGFVPERWEIPWQPRHQILRRLAGYFHVVWVTPPRWWRDWFRNAGSPLSRATFGDPQELGFAIFRPPWWLPMVGRPASVASWTADWRLRLAREMLTRRGCRKIVVYVWRPRFGDVIHRIPHDVSCYHIDDEYSFSDIEMPLDASEAQLISAVDQVFIHSPALLKKKGHLNPKTEFVPNGVDYEAFATPHEEPEDLACIPRPRVGYVGRIKPQLDLALVLKLATRHVSWSFVLIGPIEHVGESDVIRELRACRNVHLLGAKPVGKLPAYVQHLDACMLCYAVNDYTKFIYPLKLHEYLASGRPVVGSPIDVLTGFAHVVRLARTCDEWSYALSEALRPEALSRDAVTRRQLVARDHDWDRLVARIATTLGERLGEPHRSQLLDATRALDHPAISECAR